MPVKGEYHPTGDQIRHTPGAAVQAGDVIAYGTGVAVILADQEANRPVAAAIEGVFEFPKATGASTDFALGAAVGWDTTNNRIRALSGANLYAGRMHAATTTAATHCLVKINAPLPGSTA
jgi:predicted RecA/RadA family phage recombinase